MNTLKIEVNGVDITALAEKLDTLTNALTGKTTQDTAPTVTEEKLLTRMDTARLFGVTLPTLSDWTKKGLLVSYRIGNRVRYKHSEVMETLTNNKIK